MFVAGMFTMLGVTVEYANIGLAKAKMQSATDAVALAAMQAMPDESLALQNGLEIAQLYFGDDDTAAIGANDIEFGVWEPSADDFYASVVGVNSIRVIATMSSNRGNALNTIVSSLSGFGNYEIRSASIAYTTYSSPDQPGTCINGGFFALDEVKIGNNNNFNGDFCLYGADKVKLGNSNSFASSALIGTDVGGSVEGMNNSDIEDTQRFEAALDLDLIDLIDEVIADMKDGNLSGVGDFETYTVRSISNFNKHDTYIPYSLYVSSGEIDLTKQTTLEDVAFVTTKSINVGSNVSVNEVILAAEKKIDFGSNIEFGIDDYCLEGRYTVYLFAEEDIEFGSNDDLRGVQMASEKKIKMNSNISGIANVHAEAKDDIEYNTNTTFGSCSDALISDFGETPEEDDIWDCDAILASIPTSDDDESDDDDHDDDDDDDDDDDADELQIIYDENCSSETSSSYGLVL